MARQTAIAQVEQELMRVYPEGDVKAARIFRGYAMDTAKTGWHIQMFGEQENFFLGKSILDVSIFVDELLIERKSA